MNIKLAKDLLPGDIYRVAHLAVPTRFREVLNVASAWGEKPNGQNFVNISYRLDNGSTAQAQEVGNYQCEMLEDNEKKAFQPPHA